VTPGAARRELGLVLGGAVLGAALPLLAAGQEWATITAQRRPPLPPVIAAATGGELAPLAPAAALVLLASAGALLAVRGAGRAVVGVLMAVAGAAVAWSSGRVLGGADVVTTQLTALGVPSTDLVVDVVPAWPVLAAAGGVLGVLAGLVAALRGRRWPALGRRYERPGDPAGPGAAGRPAAPADDEQRAQAAWAALDRGDDPTADVPPRPTPRPAAGPGDRSP
jgi:uncharacterized membrane protein (TIGR02234 family)